MKQFSYKTAINWCHNDMVLLNNIPEIDPDVVAELYDQLEEGDEIFQYFITDCTESEVEWLKEHFSDMYFAYSEKLDNYILAVCHYGTSWDYVPVDVKDDELYEMWKEKYDFNKGK